MPHEASSPTGPPTRAHPSYIVIAALRTAKEHWEAGLPLLILATVLLKKYFSVSLAKTLLGLFLLFGIPLAGLVLLGFAHWRTHTFWLDGATLHVQYGILRRVQQKIPLRRIQSAATEADFLERLFGVVRLRIFLAESAGLKEGEILIRALPKKEAQWWMQEILATPLGPPAPSPKEEGDSAQNPPSVEIFRYSTEQAFRGALLSPPIIQSFLIVAVLYGRLASFKDGALLESLLRRIAPAFSSPLEQQLAQLVVLFFVSWVVAVAGKWIYLLRFRFYRTPEALILEEGWISLRTKVFSLERIQAIELRQSPLEKLAGMASLRLYVAGKDETHHGTIPFLLVDRLPALMNELLPQVPDILMDVHPLPASARRPYWTRFLRHAFLLVFVIPEIIAGAFFYHLPLAVDPFDAVSYLIALPWRSAFLGGTLLFLILLGIVWGEWAYRHGGYLRSPQGYVLSVCLFTHRKIFVPRHRLQEMRLYQTPWQRLPGLANIELLWLGGSVRLFHLPLEEAQRWFTFQGPFLRF
ncbi:PH domain-containing protein [Brockia lithotrophica]|uniref:Putative membrane protein YdbT with pleckstrin-like domain n=1 Tax=Brockia lithotrophica TaxID=933949 RepID=A0A660KYQ0_9BACL|nr:PH domain-containing protein [Brockia lithotrophica]RKQ83496.1 putative membrane protein YdbT with pleckstrin-like domain [Brockia lithotrophica]